MHLHNIHLFPDLVFGDVAVGVCSQLPVPGVEIGELARANVWKDNPSLCEDSFRLKQNQY